MKNILIVLFIFSYNYCLAQNDSAFAEVKHQVDSIAYNLSYNDLLLSKSYAEILKDRTPNNDVYFRKRAYQDLIKLSKKYMQREFWYEKVIDNNFYAIPVIFDTAFSHFQKEIYSLNQARALPILINIAQKNVQNAQKNVEEARQAAEQAKEDVYEVRLRKLIVKYDTTNHKQ